MKNIKNIILPLISCATLTASAQELNISNGLIVTMDGPIQLVLNNMAIANNGQFKAENGTVMFTGNTGRAFIGGTSPLVFHHLAVDRELGDLQLENRIMVNGSLTMSRGNLELNNYNIDLGTTGKIEGENRMARITGRNGGYIKITTELNNPQRVNPGNLGLQITSSKNLGRTTITRGHLQQVNDNGELSIQRYYEVDPSFASDLQAEVVAGYFNEESANLSPVDAVLWTSNDAGRNWASVKKMNNGYIISEASSLAPVRLTYFSGRSDRNFLASTYLQLYPNPVADRFTLSFNYQKQEEVMINLYNSNGQLLESRSIKAFGGLNKLDWNVGKYPGGNYQLRLIGDGMRNVSFTKQ